MFERRKIVAGLLSLAVCPIFSGCGQMQASMQQITSGLPGAQPAGQQTGQQTGQPSGQQTAQQSNQQQAQLVSYPQQPTQSTSPNSAHGRAPAKNSTPSQRPANKPNAWTINPNAVNNATKTPQAYPIAGKAKMRDLGNQSYLVYCDGFPAVAQTQQTPVWCWAACIQMISMYHGITVTQAAVVDRVHERELGDDPNSPPVRGALQWEVMRAMCPKEAAALGVNPSQTVLDKLGQMCSTIGQKNGGRTNMSVKFDVNGFIDAAKAMNFDSSDLVHSVSHGVPVMMSLNHRNDDSAHMYVIYGALYKPTMGVGEFVSQNGNQPSDPQNYELSQLYVVDPYTSKSEVKQKSDFDGLVGYMISEESVKKALVALAQTVQVH